MSSYRGSSLKLDPLYDDVDRQTAPASNALATYQRTIRVHPALVALLVVLALAGLFTCRGRERAAVVLLGGAALVTMAVPPFVLTWSWRYGVPAQPLLAAAAAFGVHGLQGRLRARKPRVA